MALFSQNVLLQTENSINIRHRTQLLLRNVSDAACKLRQMDLLLIKSRDNTLINHNGAHSGTMVYRDGLWSSRWRAQFWPVIGRETGRDMAEAMRIFMQKLRALLMADINMLSNTLSDRKLILIYLSIKSAG